jgi:hypothetical protein
MNPGLVNLIKFIGCWVCIVSAVVILVLQPHWTPAIPGVLAILAIAFAQAPAAYR